MDGDSVDSRCPHFVLCFTTFWSNLKTVNYFPINHHFPSSFHSLVFQILWSTFGIWSTALTQCWGILDKSKVSIQFICENYIVMCNSSFVIKFALLSTRIHRKVSMSEVSLKPKSLKSLLTGERIISTKTLNQYMSVGFTFWSQA